MATQSEENYLKNIFIILEKNNSLPVTTNELSDVMSIKAASVSDMLKRLSEKKLIHYKKYKGVLLTQKGKGRAVCIIRKHRMWEYFLVEKLKLQWDEVHAVAEELEHVNSDLMIDKLDLFLGHPKFDPHGDPIPDQRGKVVSRNFKNLSALAIHEKGKVAAVLEQQPAFLRHLKKLSIQIRTPLEVIDRMEFDKSMSIRINNGSVTNISFEIAKNILIAKS